MIWLLDEPLEDMLNDFEYVTEQKFDSTMNELESVGRWLGYGSICWQVNFADLKTIVCNNEGCYDVE